MFQVWKTVKCGVMAVAMAASTLGASTALAQEECGDEARVMRLSESAKSGVTLPWQQVEALGQQFAQHPALNEYVSGVSGFVLGQANSGVELETLDALLAYMETNEAVPPEFEQVVGAPPEFFEHLGNLLGQVSESPELAMMAARNKNGVLNAAVDVSPVYPEGLVVVQVFDEEAEEESEATTLESCRDECREAFLDAYEAAQDAFLEKLETCKEKSGLAKFFCQSNAGLRLTQAIKKARTAMQDCIEECNDTYGEPGGDNSCRRDSDCATDEYCAHGHGFGAHECRPKRANGDSCSRKKQCLSNRCHWRKCKAPK